MTWCSLDRPEPDPGITRVSGPFTVEGTIPPPVQDRDLTADSDGINRKSDLKFADRMLEVLRKSPVLRLEGNRTVTLKNVRPPAKSLSLSAEAIQNGEENKPVAHRLRAGERGGDGDPSAPRRSARPI